MFAPKKARSTAEQAEADEEQRPAAHRARGERHEGEDSAFAVVVGTQDVDVVLERHHDDERPDDEGEDAEHIAAGDRHCVRTEEAFTDGIQRAGPDVAIDDAERGEAKKRKPASRSFRRRLLFPAECCFADLHEPSLAGRP